MPRARWFAPLLLLAASAAPAATATLYTIEVNSSTVYTLDTVSGLRTQITPTIPQFSRPRIAHHQGLLWYIFGGSGCGGDAQIPPIFSVDLSVPSRSPYLFTTTNGAPVPYANVGGLTSDGVKMTASLKPYASPGCYTTFLLADLSPLGDFTNVTDFSAYNADMNHLVAAGDGSFYALDERRDVGQADFYRVARPSTYQLIGTQAVPASPAIYVGMALADNGELWALERALVDASGKLRRIDPATGQILQTVDVVPDAAGLNGLAAGPTPVPVRTSSWGRIKSIYR